MTKLIGEVIDPTVRCPHCQTTFTWRDEKWYSPVRIQQHCGCPRNWTCAICNKPILTPADFAEYEKNGAHVECAVEELTGTKHDPPTAPPAESVEDARAYLATDQRYCAFKSAWDLDEWDKRYAGEMLDVWIPRWMEQYAAKLLADRDKQTVEAFIAEVEKVTGVDKEYDGIAYGVFEAMHAVKEKRAK